MTRSCHSLIQSSQHLFKLEIWTFTLQLQPPSQCPEPPETKSKHNTQGTSPPSYGISATLTPMFQLHQTLCSLLSCSHISVLLHTVLSKKPFLPTPTIHTFTCEAPGLRKLPQPPQSGLEVKNPSLWERPPYCAVISKWRWNHHIKN